MSTLLGRDIHEVARLNEDINNENLSDAVRIDEHVFAPSARFSIGKLGFYFFRAIKSGGAL